MIGEILTVIFYLFGLAVLDWFMMTFWIEFYYLFGLPLYRKTFRYSNDLSNMALVDKIDSKLITLHAPFELREFNGCTVAFREKYQFAMPLGEDKKKGYNPVMHGLVKFDRHNRTVTITGIANWFWLFFIPTFIYIASLVTADGSLSSEIMRYLFIAGPPVVFFIVYYKQKKIYEKIVALLKMEMGGIDY